ncbi:MAG: guanylate kinase, partial [Hyphomicrobiaceae bacterium]
MSETGSHSGPQAGPRIARRGLLLVLSSPSGAGKTTLARRLLAAEPDLRMSVSVTTRAPRRGEVEGEDYRFIDAAEFDRLEAAGELLDWAIVHGNCYATPKAEVISALQAGEDMLFDIDWQGAQ